MNPCRICLKTPALKDISQLETALNQDDKNFVDIMLFCLDIKVTEDSKITTSLCNNCYRKIISFYKFKTLSLKNDEYLRSHDPEVQLESQKQSIYIDINGIKHENPLDFDEYGPRLVEDKTLHMEEDIKHEDNFIADDVDRNGVKYEDKFGDDFGCSDIEDSHAEIKTEVEIKGEDVLLDVKKDAKNEETLENVESDEEPLCAYQRKKSENIKEGPNIIVSFKKKRGRPRKLNREKNKITRQMCEECGVSFWNLKEHSLQHQPKSERKKLQCKACPKLFLNSNDRKRHYKVTHLGLKKKCTICNKEVTRMGAHMARHARPAAAARPSCAMCGRSYVSQAALALHMGTHTRTNYAYKCGICQKPFRSPSFLSRHIRQVHDKVKEQEHKCELCPKAFSNKKGLKKHIRTHTAERTFESFECNECGLTLKTKHTLRAHIRVVHCDVRNYHCKQCGKSFKAIATLNVHMITHTKEKKYECRYCGVRFGRVHHRDRHEFTAHKKKRISNPVDNPIREQFDQL